MALILINDHDRLFVHRSGQGDLVTNCTALNIKISGNIHAVTWKQCCLQPINLVCQWILIRPRLKKVDWRLLFMMLVEHVDVQILFENRRDEAELLRPMINADVLLIVQPVCPAVLKITPLGQPSVDRLQ